jgi:hypothetical protein
MKKLFETYCNILIHENIRMFIPEIFANSLQKFMNVLRTLAKWGSLVSGALGTDQFAH